MYRPYNMKLVREHLVNWLKNYATDNGLKGFVVGVSGGIDSAVVSALCARTGLRTVCAILPIKQGTSDTDRARKHVGSLVKDYPNVEAAEIDFSSVFDHAKLVIGSVVQPNENENLALANLRSRMRMNILYHIATINGLLVVGTGNKVEDFGVGFFTKYGDGGVDLSPIADLYKTEVYNLAYTLGVIPEILSAKPTDGLWDDGRTDEDQLGATYAELEWAMMFLETNVPRGVDVERLDLSMFEALSDRQKHVLAVYMRRHVANKHKMVPIPVCLLDKVELMNFSEETMKLVDRYRFLRDEKNRIVRTQKYEEAAKLRDEEKLIIEQMNKIDASGVLYDIARGS